MSATCETCNGRGLVFGDEDYHAGGDGLARCPDCEPPPPDPLRVAELERIRGIQRAAFGLTSAPDPEAGMNDE